MTTSTKAALLFGGGIDSFCIKELLRREGKEFDIIRFNLKTKYDEREGQAIADNDLVEWDRYVIIDMSELEKANAHVPYRNLMMCAYVAALGYDEIILGGTADDRSSDMTMQGMNYISTALSLLEHRSIVVHSPYHNLSKKQLIEKYLLGSTEEGRLMLLKTFSCYSADSDDVNVHCMRCKACLRRYIYLRYFFPDWKSRFLNKTLMMEEYYRTLDPESGMTKDRREVTKRVIEEELLSSVFSTQKQHNTYVFDIDGTLCEERDPYEPGWYSVANAKWEMIKLVKQLYDEGHTIWLDTSRHESDRLVTRQWLREHGVKYHALKMGKPKYDISVDDRSYTPDKFIEEFGG